MIKKLFIRASLAFGFWLAVQIFAFAQESAARRPLWLSARLGYGFIIPHHPSMEVFARNHVRLYEISLFRINEFTPGRLGNELNWGGSYLYSALSDTRILGDVHALVPWIEQPARFGDLSLSVRAGLGIAWLTNPFDLTNNYRNTAIGSHLNAAILLNASVSYSATPRWIWSTGASFVHFSNGSTRQPNYGINLPLIYGGVAYNLLKNRGEWKSRSDTLPYRRFLLAAQWAAGTKEIFPVNGPSYFSWFGSVKVGYHFTRRGALTGAFDLSYNASDRDYLARKGIGVASESDLLKTGVSLGIEMRSRLLTFGFSFGRYLHQLDTSEGDYYDALSLSCKVLAGLHAGLLLKTHFARADFIGLGLSYQFDF